MADEMTAAETQVLAFFRGYNVGVAEMLFFNPANCRIPAGRFQAAMKSLIDRGLVVKERPAQAYSLTQRGHEECRRVQTGAR